MQAIPNNTIISAAHLTPLEDKSNCEHVFSLQAGCRISPLVDVVRNKWMKVGVALIYTCPLCGRSKTTEHNLRSLRSIIGFVRELKLGPK